MRSLAHWLIAWRRPPPDGRRVCVVGRPVMLSRREPALLGAMLHARGRILSVDQLKDSLYGFSEEVESNALNVHIHHLRRKLGADLIGRCAGRLPFQHGGRISLRLQLMIGVSLSLLWGGVAVWMLRDLDEEMRRTLDQRLAMSARPVTAPGLRESGRSTSIRALLQVSRGFSPRDETGSRCVSTPVDAIPALPPQR